MPLFSVPRYASYLHFWVVFLFYFIFLKDENKFIHSLIKLAVACSVARLLFRKVVRLLVVLISVCRPTESLQGEVNENIGFSDFPFLFTDSENAIHCLTSFFLQVALTMLITLHYMYTLTRTRRVMLRITSCDNLCV